MLQRHFRALGAILWLVFVPLASGMEVIIDNTDPGFSVLSGTWGTATASGMYGTDFRTHATSSAATSAVEWRPDLPQAGNYEVSVWFPAASTRPNNATYTVHHTGGSTNFTISQRSSGGQWNVVGTFAFAAGTAGSVSLTDQAQTGRTIAADAVRFVSIAPAQPELRAFWVDVFHVGMQNAAQVDQMINYAVSGGYNAVVVEVLGYHDNQVGSHGAYWRSDLVARSSYVTSTFDPLAYIVERAHANGLEVHAWLVAYRLSTTWPPPGSAYLAARPEWLMVPRASTGSVAAVNGVYTFDPGSPDVQDYLVRVVREIATNYQVDGIHWDYIRYTQADAGYPSDNSYANSGLARFRRLTGRTDLPPATGDAQWDDFRRQTIDELISRCQAELPLVNNPRQPLRHTAAVITWGDAPANFTSTSAYGLFQNWEKWMRLGWLDALCPMVYYREHNVAEGHDVWYRNWIQACRTWSYDRHFFAGQANYLNYMNNSIIQMQYALEEGNADGVINYSYATTRSDSTDYWAWYPYVAQNLFTTPAPTPTMPWRDPATATDGTIFGRVLDATTGLPIDGATVQVGSLPAVQTDGNGYYVVARVPTTTTGANYSITASMPGLGSTTAPVTALAAQVVSQDLLLGSFTDCNSNGLPDACDLDCGTAGCDVSGCGQSSDCNSNGTPDECEPDPDGDQVPTECDNCPALNNPDQADGDGDGVGDACDQCLNTIAGVQVDPTGCPATIPGDFDRDGDVDPSDFEAFAACATGSAIASIEPGCESRDLDGDTDIDQTDFGMFQRCISGSGVPADPSCDG